MLLLIPLALVAAPPVAFDYYVLSLSWAPGTGKGFVVNGLWPQVNTGQNPESCGKAKKVSKRIIKTMQPYMQNASRVQQEWAVHGTCSGRLQGAYFNDVVEARSAVQLPVQFTALEEPITETPEQIENEFASANPSLPATAFRTACNDDALTEVRVCFDKGLKPQACPASVPECTATNIQIRPSQ
jgi:ribonuclease T2